MKNKICLDMYLLTLIMLAMVALGFGIRELMSLDNEPTGRSIEMRLNHLGDLQVN